MLDSAGLAASISLPLWAASLIVALLVLVSALAFIRDNDDARTGPMIGVALVLVLGMAAGWTLDYLARRDLEVERQALAARAFELTTRALMPGSALACLDSIAGASIEDSCEKALFASPEATAASVSYVAAQLALLRAARELARRDGRQSEQQFNSLRRAVETDRFGIVAHVLAERDGCTPQQCSAFALMQTSNNVSANIAQRRFDAHVRNHFAAWSSGPVRSAAGPHAEGSVSVSSGGPAKPAGDLFFPSSSSIPPVNIMSAEPLASPRPSREASGPDEVGGRRPANGAQQARQPAGQASGATGSAPMQIAPGAQ